MGLGKEEVDNPGEEAETIEDALDRREENGWKMRRRALAFSVLFKPLLVEEELLVLLLLLPLLLLLLLLLLENENLDENEIPADLDDVNFPLFWH